jgi:hypothetical protein
MKIKKPVLAAMAVLATTFAGCGGGSSPTAAVSTTNPTSTPTPTPSVPAPAPTPTPDESPTPAEPPVTRTTKVTRITLRLFVVLDHSGNITDYDTDDEGRPIIPIGYQFRLDIIAKDAKNRETAGSGEVIWHFEDESSIEVYKISNIFHPRLRAARAGSFTAWAELDGVESNRMTFEFRNQ